jgi:hypothetical protein
MPGNKKRMMCLKPQLSKIFFKNKQGQFPAFFLFCRLKKSNEITCQQSYGA